MIRNEHAHSGNLVTRRRLLQQSVHGGGGLLLANGLRGSSALAASDESRKAAPTTPTAKSVIQIFLWGGMSHNDTWDPKPESGRDYMGEFGKVISTNVAGTQLCELFPELSRQADKYALIRSMTHGNNGHETAAYLMQTGHQPGERLAYPSVGAVFALLRG
ncbi:MAG TPA: DUF1501 domain-containing protein, partial [Pirellulaceae bacterium]|nr:DUF1501 domain-containing protein [Pirellulaceae bacterium]